MIQKFFCFFFSFISLGSTYFKMCECVCVLACACARADVNALPLPFTHPPFPLQNGELMYAELSFPRGGQYPPGTLPRRKPEPTIYAQIDHGLSSNVPPVSMGVVPVSSGIMGGTSMCPSTSLSGAPICSSGMMGGGMMGGGGPPILMGNPGMVPGGIPIGDVSIAAYTTPAPPPHGFGGHPLAPAVVPEEDEQATAETPLMTNPKESEV